jgi:hypothetical protein
MSENEFWKSTYKQLAIKAKIYKKFSSNQEEDREAYADEVFL